MNELVRKRLHELVLEYGKSDVYLVGGALRNEIGNIEVGSDIDLVCKDSADFTSWLKYTKPTEVSSFSYYERSRAWGFLLSVKGFKSVWIECSDLAGDDLKVDSETRDFCCNSVYQSLRSLKIYDPTMRGLLDIKEKILRTPISPEVTFQNDPLRLLRVLRFSGTLGFSIDLRTRKGIKPYPSYYQLPLERIRGEFSKIILSPQAVSIIRDLHEFGLLRYIIPQLSEGWGFNQNSKYHSQSLSDHLLGVLQFVIEDSRSSSESLRLAALLHDISKYREYQIKEDGSYSYHGHEESSSKIAIQILERLGYSEEIRKEVSGLIKFHMILKPYGDPYGGSFRTTRRILRKLDESSVNFRKLMILIDGDNHNHSPKYNLPTQVDSFMDEVSRGKPIIKSSVISGEIIMKAFGLKPGKLVGEIKDIMKTYSDLKSSLSEDDLIRMYREEFEGKTLWLWEQYGSVYASQSKPDKLDSGGYIETDITGLHNKEVIECEAFKYPSIWRELEGHRRAHEIIQKAFGILEGLYEIPDFKSITLTFDEYHDLSGVIQKYNGKPEYIL